MTAPNPAAIPLMTVKLPGIPSVAETPGNPLAPDAVVLLTQQMAEGDEEAFRRFHQLYFDRLYQFLLAVARGREQEASAAVAAAIARRPVAKTSETMRTSDKNQLLNEVLGGDELDAFREATLASGLDALRRRTRRRRQFQGAAIMASLLVLMLHEHFRPARPAPSKSDPAPPPLVEAGEVKYITEKELFALFPNRPVALIGEPGHQQFLLLDELGPNRGQ